MYIERLELENFINIYIGMGYRKLTLDFLSRKHTICVITGGNGKGKTSLLSYLTPFATLGTLDIRESSSLIIPEEKGYKRIVIVDDKNGDKYDIKHYYTPHTKGSHSVKSYLELNGEELNPNGNVTSFKSLISYHLGLEMNYLKLIRLGDNVSNLIKLKATERKEFMAKLLEEIDTYLKDNKFFVQKRRESQAILTHIEDGLVKTGITDSKEEGKEILRLQDVLEKLIKGEKEAASLSAAANAKLEAVGFPSNGLMEMEYFKLKLERLSKSLKDNEGETADSVSNDLKDIEIELAKVTTKLELLSDEHSSLMKDLDDAELKLQEIAFNVEKEENDTNLSSVEEYLGNLTKRVEESYKESYDKDFLPCSLEDFSSFMLFLKNTQILLNTTYAVGKGPIKEVLEGFRKRINIQNKINANLLALEGENHKEHMSMLDKLINKYSSSSIECDRGCPYKELAEDLRKFKKTIPTKDKPKSADFYEMMQIAFDNLTMVFKSFEEYKKVIEALPKKAQEMFTEKEMFSHIEKTEIIFNEKLLNEYLAFLTDRDNYRKLQKELESVSLEYETLKKNSKLSYLVEELESYRRKVDELKDKIKDNKDSIKELTDKEKSLSLKKDSLNLLYTALTEYESIKAQYEDLCRMKEEVDKRKEEVNAANRAENECSIRVSSLREEIYKRKANLEKYASLSEELIKVQEAYTLYDNLSFASSNKSGIPLYYIDLYLQDTVDIANGMLDIVYDGNLYLDSFDINESEFRMPYVKNGVVINDVISASQGEQGFLNLAISSALRSQSLSKYNIALLDEVDGAFDDANRQKFIPVIEKMLTDISQAFVITHNQMFKQYPVDTINLDDLTKSTIDVWAF